mgnify:FL=1
MNISSVCIQNFRKLYQCHIDFSNDTTLFVGANNSGKTSAMDALGKFLAGRPFAFNDITISNRELINQIGKQWETVDCEKPNSLSEWGKLLPSLDVWLNVNPQDIHYVVGIIPTLKWRGGRLGVRLIYQPRKIEGLFTEYRESFFSARETEKACADEKKIRLFPNSLCEYLERYFTSSFVVKSYILDPEKFDADSPQETEFGMECLVDNPLTAIIRIDTIGAQRNLSDPDKHDGTDSDRTRLSTKIRSYYDKYLDPEKTPLPEDLEILAATEQARKIFDSNLENKFKPAIKELEELGYPGIANPRITITSKVTTTEMLRHDSAVQYSLGEKDDGLILPEKYNGLGYQNLISIVFDLISYRDGWMRVGKSGTKDEIIEPLHLVLVEEPEAHLHVQVQQVFIRKAYSVLRNHEKLGKSDAFSTQLVISTHSSHIAREEEFANLRYFKRLPKDFEGKVATSKVVNLSDVFGKDDATKRFVTRYLQTTHCDLFFADGVILVEGSAEHMLLPHFIRNKYLKLNQRYITILNINGKHSHRLAPLIDKLALPTLVIADLDSAEPTGHHKKAEPVRKQGLISGNYAITDWLIKKRLIDDLIDLPDSSKVFSMQSICHYQIRIAYQTPIKICYQNKEIEALSRTFEDSLIYSNWDTFEGMSVSDPGQLIRKLKEGFDNKDSFETIKSKIFESLKQSDVKAEFALDLIYSIDPNMMVVPQYIDEGLKWLEDLLYEEE